MTTIACNNRTVGLLSALMAVGAAVVFGFGTIGAQTSFGLWRWLGVVFFILLAPVQVANWRVSKSKTNWFDRPAWLLLCVLLLLPVVGYLLGSFASYVGLLLSVLGYACLAGNLVVFAKIIRVHYLGLFCLGAVSFGALLASIIWGSAYQTPLVDETLMVGKASVDTIFHSAFANMISTYGVPSSGVDGLVYIPYHYGTHFFFAQMARLTHSRVIDMYNIGYVLLVPALAPFALASVVLAASDLQTTLLSKSNKWFWLTLLVGFIGVLPVEIAKSLSLGTERLLLSESYCFAVIYIALVSATVVAWVRSGVTRVSSVSDYALVFLLPVLVFVGGAIKVSVGVILVVLVCYGLLRLPATRTMSGMLSVVLTIVAYFAMKKLFVQPGLGAEISPFNFLRSEIPTGAMTFFCLLMFSWFLVFVWLRIRGVDASNLRDVITEFRANSLIDVEMLTLLVIVCTVPPMLVVMAAGGGLYFLDIQYWISLAAVLSLVVKMPAVVTSDSEPSERASLSQRVMNSTPSQWQKLVLLAVAGAWLLSYSVARSQQFISRVVAIRFAVAYPDEKYPGVRQLLKNVLQSSRKQNQKQNENLFSPDWRKLVFVSDAATTHPNHKLISELHQLAGLSDADKTKKILFIPWSNTRYWNLKQRGPWASPFLAPALTGMCLIDGLPPKNVKMTTYGYLMYPPRAEDQRDDEEYMSSLKNRASKMMFDEVLVLQDRVLPP